MLILFLPLTASAQVQVGVEDWGLGGGVKSGLWTPLYVELKSTGADFTGRLEVQVTGHENVDPLFVKDVKLVRDTATRHWLYFRSPVALYYGMGEPRFSWVVRDQRGRAVFSSTWPRPRMFRAADTVVAVLRTPEAMTAGLGSLIDAESKAAETHVVWVSPRMAPDRAAGYEGADALVWLNPDPAEFVALGQSEAVAHYVRQGGHLVLAAGDGWQALARSFLADLLPATPVGTDEVADPFVLAPYGLPGTARSSIVLMRLENPRGEALLGQGGRPVVLRRSVGAGRVTLVAFDPTKKPFTDLADRRRFWSMVLDVRAARVKGLGSFQAASDVLRGPLTHFPGFTPVNFVLVGFFLAVYVVLIGPVDYAVLKRKKKLHWTWVTFPSAAVLSSILAFTILSANRLPGLLVNSVALVDATAGSDEASGTMFLAVMAPRQARFTADVPDADGASVVPRDFPLGIGESALTRTTCEVDGPGDQVRDLLVRLAMRQTIEASWRSRAAELPEVDLVRRAGGLLAGTVRNTTDSTLRDAVLLYAGAAFALGTLEPGRSASLDGAQQTGVAAYAANLDPRSIEGGERDAAGHALRWFSLFSYFDPRGAEYDRSQGGLEEEAPGPGRLRRYAPGGRYGQGLAFDFPARFQLTGLESRREAVLLYTVTDHAFAAVRLAGWNPAVWTLSVVRLRVPVADEAPASQPEKGSDPLKADGVRPLFRPASQGAPR